jgi:hypothetical protein
VVARMHVGQAYSQSGDKCWNLLFVIILIGEKIFLCRRWARCCLVLAGERQLLCKHYFDVSWTFYLEF